MFIPSIYNQVPSALLLLPSTCPATWPRASLAAKAISLHSCPVSASALAAPASTSQSSLPQPLPEKFQPDQPQSTAFQRFPPASPFSWCLAPTWQFFLSPGGTKETLNRGWQPTSIEHKEPTFCWVICLIDIALTSHVYHVLLQRKVGGSRISNMTLTTILWRQNKNKKLQTHDVNFQKAERSNIVIPQTNSTSTSSLFRLSSSSNASFLSSVPIYAK